MTVREKGVRISHRETRLRSRIDDLIDQRDKALAELWESREQNDQMIAELWARNDELDRRIDRLHESNSRLRRDRDKWRDRAKAAEWGTEHNPGEPNGR